MCRIRFIFCLLRLNHHRILYNLCCVYFADHGRVDGYLAFIFRTLSDATHVVYELFAVITQRHIIGSSTFINILEC